MSATPAPPLRLAAEEPAGSPASRPRERTEQLMRITSAIADAVTPAQVFHAVVDGVAAAVGAEAAGLWTATPEKQAALLVHGVGMTDATRRTFAELPLAAAGRMPAADALLSGEALFIESREDLVARYPHLTREVRQGPYHVACLPIEVDGRTFGVMSFTFPGCGQFDEEERAFLRVVARHSGQALERLRLLEAEHRARVRAELLVGLASAVIESERVEQVFDAALDAIQRALRSERASVLLFDAAGVMRFRASRGISETYRASVEGHSPWSPATRAAEPIVVSDVRTDPGLAAYVPVFDAERIRGLVFFPLMSGGRVIGKFMVYYAEPARLDAGEIELARAIANHVATAAARFAAIDDLRDTVHFNEMFTAILGHDLRNPLGGIMAAAQLAMRRSEGEKLQKPLGRIVNSAERMARMIDQLLDFTRVRVGEGIPLKPSPVDLDPIVRQVIEELTDAHPDWTFLVDRAGDMRGHWDADRLAQVFSNLAGNAVQHGEPAGGVRVTMRGIELDRVTVEVHNAGAVPPELLPHLFEPMTGGDRRREKSVGLGLGLYITRQITSAHGGTIHVSSSGESGTTISVVLPRAGAGLRPERSR